MRYLYVLPFVEGKDLETKFTYIVNIPRSCFSNNAEGKKKKTKKCHLHTRVACDVDMKAEVADHVTRIHVKHGKVSSDP